MDQWRYERAKRIVDLVEARGVLEQAKTYTDAEWLEAAVQPAVPEVSQIIIAICRTAVGERTKDPFRGLA